MQMVTWHSKTRVTVDDEIASDEAELALKLLPLRCKLDQRAIRFAQTFFDTDGDGNEKYGVLPTGLRSPPPPLFRSSRVRPFKLKVDYNPERIDTTALRNGAIVELVNLSPLDGMILTLKDVSIANEVGVGAVLGKLVRSWIQDICSTQLIKFLGSSRPLEPITTIGSGALDLVVLPWEAIQNGDSMKRALRAGVSSFSNAVTYEAFTLSSRVAEFLADTASRVASVAQPSTGQVTQRLPSRPTQTPRNLSEASPHAVESLSRGIQTANYKIIIVPYHEYHRSGASGAVKSVLRGIPVAVAAPASGMAEALSFTLLGARNQLRPDIRAEEEASTRGLQFRYAK